MYKLISRYKELIGFGFKKTQNRMADDLLSMRKKQRILYSFIAIALSLLAVYGLGSEAPPKVSIWNIQNPIKTVRTNESLESQFRLVERFEVNEPLGTIIFIPQIHKEPTANNKDPKNDRAEVVQREIYTMLSKLVDVNGINLIMDEADIYGPMPESKVSSIKTSLIKQEEFKNNFKGVIDQYLQMGGSREVANKALEQTNGKLRELERDLYLTGSAAVLAATNSNAIVYGSQNPETINEARRQLQNIVYMEKRIAQLEGKSGPAKPSAKFPELQNILSLLGSNELNEGDFFKQLKSFAEASSDVDFIDKVRQSEENFNNIVSKQENDISPAALDKSAQENPFANKSNLGELKNEYKRAYDGFMRLAKDQRSEEVAVNSIKMLDQNKENTGILVFGAQHKEQIINSLNQKKYNVIVLTPESEITKHS